MYFVADFFASSALLFCCLAAGDTVSVLEAPTVKDGTFVKVLPYLDDVENIKGDLIDTLLRYVCPKERTGEEVGMYTCGKPVCL